MNWVLNGQLVVQKKLLYDSFFFFKIIIEHKINCKKQDTCYNKLVIVCAGNKKFFNKEGDFLMDFKKTFSDLVQKAKKAGEKGVKMAVAQKDIMVLKGQIKDLKVKIADVIIQTNEINDEVRKMVSEIAEKENKIKEIEESLKEKQQEDQPEPNNAEQDNTEEKTEEQKE